jgi:hypothetical protein
MFVACDFKIEIEIDETSVYVCLYAGYVCMSIATSTICLEGKDYRRSKIGCLLALLLCRTTGWSGRRRAVSSWSDSIRMFWFHLLQARIDAVVT